MPSTSIIISVFFHPYYCFLVALAALYLTLVSQSVTDSHFRILTQRVTFEIWDQENNVNEDNNNNNKHNNNEDNGNKDNNNKDNKNEDNDN